MVITPLCWTFISRRSSGMRIYQRGEPLLSKITLYGRPPPPRLSMNMGSGSGLLRVVMLMSGKSLGTETPLGIVVARPIMLMPGTLPLVDGGGLLKSSDGTETVTAEGEVPGKW